MSLLHPTLGEMCDRAYVLQLKIRHGEKSGVDVNRFRDELTEIRQAIKERHFGVPAELSHELLRVHMAIWDMLPQQAPPELTALNARRVELREQIDKLSGEWKGPEKV